jgi:hypothetical protein
MFIRKYHAENDSEKQLMWSPGVSREEMIAAGIITDPEISPLEFETNLKSSMHQRRADIDAVLRIPISRKAPHINLGDTENIDNWNKHDWKEKVVEIEQSHGHYVATKNFEKNFADIEKIKQKNSKTKRNLEHLVGQLKKSDRKLYMGHSRNDLNNFLEVVKQVKSKRDLYLLGELYKNGVWASVYDDDDLRFFKDFDLLGKVLSVKKQLRPNREIYVNELRSCYQSIQDLGDDYLETIITAVNKTEELKKQPFCKNHISIRANLEYISPINHLDKNPYICESLKNLSLADAECTANILDRINAASERIDEGTIDFQAFVYLAEFVGKHKESIEKTDFSRKFLTENNLLYTDPVTTILLLVYAPETLPVPSGNAGDESRMVLLADRYSTDKLPLLKELVKKFNVENSLETYAHSGDDLIEKSNSKIAPLKYLSTSPKLQQFIKNNFEVTDLSKLSKITKIILENRSDPRFEEKINFAKNFHTPSSKKLNTTGLEILSRQDVLQKWFENPKIFATAKKMGLFENNITYFNNYVAISDVVKDPRFVEFVEENNDIHLVNLIRLFRSHQSTKNILRNWFEDQETFYKAKNLGCFNKTLIKSNIENYEEISSIMKNSELSEFIKVNQDIPAINFSKRMISEIKKRTLEKWLKDKKTFYIAKRLGFFDKETDISNIDRYDHIVDIAKNPKIVEFIKTNNDIGLTKILCSYGKITDNIVDIIKKWFSNQKAFYVAKKMGLFSKEQDPKKALSLYKELSHLNNLDENEIHQIKNLQECPHFLEKIIPKITTIQKEKRQSYIKIFEAITESPSQEMQRIKNQLISQICETANPEKSYQQIEKVFIKNNLPIVGKVFKIFRILHPPEVMQKKIAAKTNTSPYLQKSKTRRRYLTIYNDLLRIHIGSGNRNLREYIETIQDSQVALKKLENVEINNLSAKDKKQLEFFFRRLETLFDNSQRAEHLDVRQAQIVGDLRQNYQALQSDLGVKERQSVSARITEMYLKPLGYSNIEQVLKAMKQAKQKAHERNIELAKTTTNGCIEIQAGDLLKGVDVQYINNILQNGSVAKEYLGASSNSDMTPFDTDLSLVTQEDAKDSFEKAINASMASGYGQLLLAIKDRGQLQETNPENVDAYDPSKLELFRSQKQSSRHYGIRTGFPSTEIDFMIALEGLKSDKGKLEEIFIEIAQNGFYIPVVDKKGKVIFTPEDYQKYRRFYQGLDRFDGDPFKFVSAKTNSAHSHEVQKVIQKMQSGKEKTQRLSQKIRNIVKEALAAEDIKLKDEFDTSIIGAELHDIGSTARLTHDPSSPADFDLTIRVDEKDTDKVMRVVQYLRNNLNYKDDSQSHKLKSLYQLRLTGVKNIDTEATDVDVGFVKKSDLVHFTSDKAVQEKLNWIRKNIGETAYQETIANIILTKKILKSGKAYKKVEHGGFGGIGVENWILDNHGNLVEAFRSFLNASQKAGSTLSLHKFQKEYQIINPGVNDQKLFHDNFTKNLNEKGYQAMLKAIKKYLKAN